MDLDNMKLEVETIVSFEKDSIIFLTMSILIVALGIMLFKSFLKQ